MLGTMLRKYIYGIPLWIDVVIELVSLDRSFDCSNDGKLVGLFLRYSLGSTDSKLLRSDKGIKLGTTDGKVIGGILRKIIKSHLVLMLK